MNISEQLLNEIVQALNRININLEIIAFILFVMLLFKDMGHGAAEKLALWKLWKE
jgi:hypothetical protein